MFLIFLANISFNCLCYQGSAHISVQQRGLYNYDMDKIKGFGAQRKKLSLLNSKT